MCARQLCMTVTRTSQNASLKRVNIASDEFQQFSMTKKIWSNLSNKFLYKIYTLYTSLNFTNFIIIFIITLLYFVSIQVCHLLTSLSYCTIIISGRPCSGEIPCVFNLLHKMYYNINSFCFLCQKALQLKFPMFTLSGKIENEIPRFLCTVATLHIKVSPISKIQDC